MTVGKQQLSGTVWASSQAKGESDTASRADPARERGSLRVCVQDGVGLPRLGGPQDGQT